MKLFSTALCCLALSLFSMQASLAKTLHVSIKNEVANKVFTIDYIGEDKNLEQFENKQLTKNDSALVLDAELGPDRNSQYYHNRDFELSLSTDNASLVSCSYSVSEGIGKVEPNTNLASRVFNASSFAFRNDYRCDFQLKDDNLSITIRAGKHTNTAYPIAILNNTNYTVKIVPELESGIHSNIKDKPLTIAPHAQSTATVKLSDMLQTAINTEDFFEKDDPYIGLRVSVITPDGVDATVWLPELSISSTNNTIIPDEVVTFSLFDGLMANFVKQADGTITLEINPIPKYVVFANAKKSDAMTAQQKHARFKKRIALR